MKSRTIAGITFSNINSFLKLSGIASFIILGIILFNADQYNRNSILVVIIPIIFGIIYENRRLSEDWQIILLKIFTSLLISLTIFIPGKEEQNYSFEARIGGWPYAFIFLFALISLVSNEDKATAKLTEGITLIQTVSLIYWLFDIGYDNVFGGIVTIGIIGVFSAISLIHAFSHIKLSKSSRLLLSLWSSIIMITFAIDYIVRVLNLPDFEKIYNINGISIAFQYFMLGICLIYIFQNIVMLIIYIPSKHRFFNKKYKSEIRDMNASHINRYSEDQVNIADSLIAFSITSGVYYLNYHYKFISSDTLIWIMFWTLPPIIMMINQYLNKENTTGNTA